MCRSDLKPLLSCSLFNSEQDKVFFFSVCSHLRASLLSFYKAFPPHIRTPSHTFFYTFHNNVKTKFHLVSLHTSCHSPRPAICSHAYTQLSESRRHTPSLIQVLAQFALDFIPLFVKLLLFFFNLSYILLYCNIIL